jgi:iron complex outermembrane receptor protein
MPKLLSALLFCLAMSVNARAATESAVDLFSLSLDELMNVKLDIASKQPETVRQAPSAVTLFSRSEIMAMGIDNVYDLLNYVPGFQTSRSIDVVQEPLILSRGVANLNGDVLFMLNGHRLNENSQGRVTRFVRYIPTANVKQVEVIRGPGSALYGSNALFGVVNIITVSGVNEAEVHGGSYDAHGGYLNLSRKLGRVNMDTSFSYDSDRGEKYNIAGQQTRDPRHDFNFYSSLSLGDTTLDLSFLQHKDEDFISFNGVGDIGATWSDTRYMLAALSHAWHFGDNLKVKASLAYSQHAIESSGWFKAAAPSATPAYSYDRLLGPYSKNSSYDAKLETSYRIASGSSLDMGLVYRRAGQDFLGVCTNYLSADHSLTASDANYLGECVAEDDIPSLDSREIFLANYGIYSQYRRQLPANFDVIAGARFDHYEVSGEAISPRLGLIWQYNDTTVKLFWGSAFRAPTIAELYTDSPRSQGNPSLDPETVETTEMVFQQHLRHLELEGVLFHNTITDSIDRELNGSIQTWVNGPKRNFEGAEARIIWDIAINLRLYLTHTHIFTNLAPSSYDDFSSFIVNYQAKGWRINLNGIYRDEQDIALDQNDYIVLNSKVSYQVTKILTLYGKADNLLDYDYNTYEDDVSSTAFDSVPNKGLRLIFGLEAKW